MTYANTKPQILDVVEFEGGRLEVVGFGGMGHVIVQRVGGDPNFRFVLCEPYEYEYVTLLERDGQPVQDAKEGRE